MSLRIKHNKVSAKADGVDSTEVRPSDWNEDHKVETEGTSGIVLGRDATGPGDIQELPLAYDPTGSRWIANTTGSLRLPKGTTLERPALPQAGEVRFNTNTKKLEVYGVLGSETVWLEVGTGAPISEIPVGATMGWYRNSLPTGRWLFANSKTIGPTGSGATARANNDVELLFKHLWELPDSLCPVLPVRGASADLDWDLGTKTIGLPDECGRVSAGADNMGGVAAKNRLTAAGLGVAAVTGAVGGLEVRAVAGTTAVAPIIESVDQAAATGSVSGDAHVHAFTANTSVVQPTIIKNVIIRY